VVLAQSSASLSNNRFEQIALEAIRLHACNLAIGECHPAIVGNSFSHTKAPILHVAPLNPVLSGNQATDNETNGYVFQKPCAVQGQNTWYGGDLPYVVHAPGDWCDIGWSAPVQLTIQPGTVVKLADTLAFHQNVVVTATGTAEAPIVFTSLQDDSFGGDTNNDGNASSPQPRDWGMVDHDGVQVQGTYEHAIFRYGGGSQVSEGPTVRSQAGAQVVVRRSEISQSGGTGFRVLHTSSLTLEESEVFDHRDACMELRSTGDVLIENNRIQRCPAGIWVYDGTPAIRGNYFEGNQFAVDVRLVSAAPVVSPHNRFVGKGQTAIRNINPMDRCINAQFNWWGDVSGPADTSTAADACGLLDNADGRGAPVSNGVNYTLWEGGTGRPVMGWPRCGVTARSRPVFTGWAAVGATVLFYDDGALIGQTVAAADSTFTWMPPAPLADGPHTLSAVAQAGDETSLPTPPLELEVDSSLPFDPMGVLVAYDMHGRTYTQRMRDENGCATLAGALEMPLWVRPGTDLTVMVPMRSAFLPPLSGQTSIETREAAAAAETLAPARLAEPSAVQATLTLANLSHGSTFTNMGIAPRVNGTMYGKYHNVPLDNMVCNDVRTFELDPGEYELVFLSGPDNIVDRRHLVVESGADPAPVVITPQEQNELVVRNDTGRDFTEMYLLSQDFTGADYIMESGPIAPIANGETRTIKYPRSGESTLALRDTDGALYLRYVSPLPSSRPQEALFSSKDPGTSVSVSYGGKSRLCELILERVQGSSGSGSLSLLELLNHAPLTEAAPSLTFRLEPGSYNVRALECGGLVAGRWRSKQISGPSATINVSTQCTPPGRIRLGQQQLQALATSSGELQCSDDIGGFRDCTASTSVSASKLSVDMCYEPSDGEGASGWELAVGQLIIDPDGYVYDATVGLEAKVAGATVTCEVYDEDYQAWSIWPAAFYEGQINPQVTADDGYYAFFVPPGLYRVWASALAFRDHISPDIRVISEIVHYNIPLQPGGDRFLPLLLR
jgi:hypothetical protein